MASQHLHIPDIIKTALEDNRILQCSHPQERLETVDVDHIYCNNCCGHFFLERRDFNTENTLRLKNDKLNGIIREIQNIIDVNCLGEIDGN